MFRHKKFETSERKDLMNRLSLIISTMNHIHPIVESNFSCYLRKPVKQIFLRFY